jgi:hypothetical protein
VQSIAKNEQVELTGELVREAGSLRIQYTLENRTADELFLTARTKLELQDSRRPYTVFRAADSAIVLSFVMCPPPPGVEIYAPHMASSVKVAGHAIYRDIAEVTIPIEEMHPYSEPAYPRDLVTVEVSKLIFATEYVMGRDTKFVRDLENPKGFYRAGGSPQPHLELQFELDPPVAILKRTGVFYRCYPAMA